MNFLLQYILVFMVFAGALGFLVKKFFWQPKIKAVHKKTSGPCGTSDCGCGK